MTNALKIFLPATLSFIIGLLLTPVATHFFFKYKLWRRTFRNNNGATGKFHEIHDDSELSVPRVGGMIIWVSVIIVIFLLGFSDYIFNTSLSNKLYFISRNQTVLPLFTLI
ncbi:MAG TPA: hypothetical protein VFE57_10760, partial [Cyclobacteriaceae bacterium]|nr:hypothetical protein [Cyclobacteriaceae bacterium]